MRRLRLAGARALAGLSRARMPRHGAHRFPLRCQWRALFPRGQPACRAQSAHSDLPILAAQNGVRVRRADRHDPRRRACRATGLAPQAIQGAPAETRLMARTPAASSRSCMRRRTSRPDEIDTLVAAEAVARALGRLGFRHRDRRPSISTSAIFHALKRRADPLLVFNLVDAVRGDGRLAPVVPAMLDAVGLALYRRRIPTLGSIRCRRSRTKLKLARAGLPTPGFVGGRRATRSRCARHRQAGVGAWLARARRGLGGEAAPTLPARSPSDVCAGSTEHFAESYRRRARVQPLAA